MNITKKSDNIRDKVDSIVCASVTLRNEAALREGKTYTWCTDYEKTTELIRYDIELLRRLRDEGPLTDVIVSYNYTSGLNDFKQFQRHCVLYWSSCLDLSNLDIIKLMELI